MKKIKCLTLLTVGLTTIPFISITSCGNKKNIDEPTQEQKQHVCDPDSNVCTYEVNINESVNVDEITEVVVELTNVKADEGISISLTDEKPVRNNRKITFKVQIVNQTNNQTTKGATFSAKFDCKKGDQSIFNQTIDEFKITKAFDTEKHQINVSTPLTDIEITCDKTTVNETDEFTLTIKNNRTEAIDDANLSIIVGDQHSNVDLIGALEASAEKTLTFTKKEIKETYFSEVTIADDAAFDFKVVRCGSYNVDSDNYVYKLNYNNENGSKLTKEEIPENKFMMKNSYGEYQIHTETLEQFLSAATESSYELTMLRGEFGNGTGQSTSAACNLKMSGVLDASGERVSKFIAYGAENEGYLEPLLGYGNVSFDFNNMFIQGRDGKHGGNYFWQGMLCPNINATNCYFSGALTIWYGKSIFKDCTFDSTKTYKDAGSGTIKNNYPLWIYTEVEAEFYGCTFKSIGKAIKVGPGGELTKKSTTFKVIVDDCDFNLEDPSSEFGTMAEYEYPITADTSLLITNKYNVVINNCRVNNYWTQKKSGVSVNKLYWIKDSADAEGYANHITINGSKVTVDEPV